MFFLISDSSTLRDHHIVDGSKLHLSVKKQSEGASSGNNSEFFGLLRDLLRSHFSEQDTEQVMKKFKEVCCYLHSLHTRFHVNQQETLVFVHTFY